MAVAAAAMAGGIASAVFTGVQAGTQLYALKPSSTKKEPEQADPVVKIYTHEVSGFKTLDDPLNEVLTFLTEENKIKGILINGSIGTGKTTIMQNLNNHVLVAEKYDIVIWLKVSSDGPDGLEENKNFSVQNLQMDVMQRLKLDLDHTIPVGQYKGKIMDKLSNMKYLLLLDNVKAPLDLEEIGFPKSWLHGHSKVVLTARSRFVWPEIVDRVVDVELLQPEEARIVFSDILERSDNQIVKKYIPQVIKRCGFLLAVIKIVAHSFKLETDEQTIRDKIKALENWPEERDTIITDICGAIGGCCVDLTNEQKGCFYYGALYPEEGNICKDNLLDCWMADNNFKENRDHWDKILKQLNKRNFFEEGVGKTYFRMHKLYRLLALYNMQTDWRHKCLVPKLSLDQQDEHSWEGKHWISLTNNNNLKPFLKPPGCSELSTVFLQGNSNFTSFPGSFFEEMGRLRVLDMMGTSIESLPDSFGKSTELEVLCLNECTKLLHLSSVLETLKLLRVLDISGSGFKEVPKQIQKLKNLRRFHVSSSAISGTDKISEIISKLAKLEEMLIDTKSKKETFDWKIIKDVPESVKPLKSFRLRLRFLNNEVVDVWEVEDGVRKFFGYKVLNDTELDRLFQGCLEYYSGGEPTSTVRLLSPNALVIAKRDDLKNLEEDISTTCDAIIVENCKEMTYIFGEHLYLNDMKKLESLRLGNFDLYNFGKLKTLKLCRCLLLTEIITADAEVDKDPMSTGAKLNIPVFQNLEELVLVDMPNLKSIWENESLEFPALIKVEISNCPELNYFPISHMNTVLKSIKTERTWWGALKWTDLAAKEYFWGDPDKLVFLDE